MTVRAILACLETNATGYFLRRNWHGYPGSFSDLVRFLILSWDHFFRERFCPHDASWCENLEVKDMGLSRSHLSDCNRFLLPYGYLTQSGGYALYSPSLTKRSGHYHRRGNDGSHRNTHVRHRLYLGSTGLHIAGQPR